MNSEHDDQSNNANQPQDSSLSELHDRQSDESKPISSRWDLQESWADLEKAIPVDLQTGDIVPGVVVAIQDEHIVVDVGAKYEGVIPRNEFISHDELPEQDEQIEVAVVHVDEDKGLITLSKKRADYERVWRRLYDAKDNSEVIIAMVTERVKGGLRVDVGLPGFVPASQVAVRDVRQLDRFVGKTLRLNVLEVNRHTNQIILTHRQVIEKERAHRRQQTLARLKPGTVCEGCVRNLTNYGAFIDLGGVDGLLHISEMAWTHIDHPSQVLKSGEIVRVMVLSIENDGNRISLGRRQILPDPWKEAAQQLEVGSVLSATITRIVSTGAFARLADTEIEGFIPISQISTKRINSPSEVISSGQQVQVKLLDLSPQTRRMTLSLAQAETETDRQEYEEYIRTQQASPVKLGDQFGDMLREAKASIADVSKPEEEGATEEPSAEAEQDPAREETPADETVAEERQTEAEAVPATDQETPATEPETDQAPPAVEAETSEHTSAEAVCAEGNGMEQ